MSYVKIQGGIPLHGEIKVQGSKNAVLPILAAALLSEEEIEIENCPKITDVESMLILLSHLGVSYQWKEDGLLLRASHIHTTQIRKEDTELTRASILVLGAMLGRKREVEIAYPGGCAIGKRPIDYHLEGFRKLNVVIEEDNNSLFCQGRKLAGAKIVLPFPSVGATENIMLAATLANGMTQIINAATEPEIKELGQFLLKAGAKIYGLGTDQINIEGVEKLKGCKYHLGSDRIVTGTYLAAVAATQGEIELKADCRNQLQAVFSVLNQMGADIQFKDSDSREKSIYLNMKRRPRSVKKLYTGVYPEFPTDLQSPFLAVLAIADGKSMVEENIFENRFKTAKELNKMGADIIVKEQRAFVRGKEHLIGNNITAPDLRGGAALVIAGLAAEGITKVGNIEYINRGYENYYKNLRKLGAHIEQIEE